MHTENGDEFPSSPTKPEKNRKYKEQSDTRDCAFIPKESLWCLLHRSTSTDVWDWITAAHPFNNHFSYGQLWLFSNATSLNGSRNVEWETIGTLFTDIPRLTQQLRSRRAGTVWIQPTYALLYTYLPRSPLWTSELQNTGTWRATAWRHLLCYRSAIFFRHCRLTAYSFPAWKNSGRASKTFLQFLIL